MPFTQVLIGPEITILQNVVYALPPRACVITTTAVCQVSVDNSVWTSFASGDVTSAAFIRCTGSDANIIAKASEDAGGSGGSGDVVGPASAIINDIVIFATVDGKEIADSLASISPDNIEAGNQMLVMNEASINSHDFALRSIVGGVGVSRPDGVQGRIFGARHFVGAGAGINASAFPVSIWSDQRQGFQAASGRQFGWTASATESADTLDTAFSRAAAGVVEINNGTPGAYRDLITRSVRGSAVTFANRPGTPVEGMIVAFTDSTTDVWGATITGTGALHVLGYYNGTNWTVIGK